MSLVPDSDILFMSLSSSALFAAKCGRRGPIKAYVLIPSLLSTFSALSLLDAGGANVSKYREIPSFVEVIVSPTIGLFIFLRISISLKTRSDLKRIEKKQQN